MTRHRDLRAIALAAAILAVLAVVVPVDWISFLLLAPVAFFLTGYTILLACFVEKPQPWPRAFWISLALSLAVLALLPLPLNFLGGLRPGTWSAGLVLVVLGAAAIAAARRGSYPSAEAPARPALPRPSPFAALLGLGALALAAGAIVLSQTTVSNSDAEGFTALWLKPAPGQGPGEAKARIGIDNQEQHYTTYEVTAKFIGGGEVTRTLSLYPGSHTTFDLAATPQPTPDDPTFVAVTLKRKPEEGAVAPYRRVYGWIPASTEE
ncbi:MAG: hypothetical protein JST53_08225 [Actinobacteria bacterium]|nr:hypothetical protein [Actinomycetota bacterium]